MVVQELAVGSVMQAFSVVTSAVLVLELEESDVIFAGMVVEALKQRKLENVYSRCTLEHLHSNMSEY